MRVSGAEELESGPPDEVVLENAYRKARAVADGLASERSTDDAQSRAAVTVLGADTVVEFGGRVYGKPRDEAHARETLGRLSGRTHRVLSGICVIETDPGGTPVSTRTAAAATQVTFRRIDTRFLDWYLGTGEWRDRAGGYAIQGRGAALVGAIQGDYLNVVGLPVPTLLDLLPDLLH